MNIHEEFEKLKQLASTDEGMAEIEKAFSDPKDLVGFAIDPQTLRHEFANKEIDPHFQAKYCLLAKFLEEDRREFERVEDDVIDGRAVKFIGYQLPLIILMRIETEHLVLIETRILEHGIGLPVNSLFLKHQGRH